MFACSTCARRTRGADGIRNGLCRECDELSMTENGILDGAYTVERGREEAQDWLRDCVKRGSDEERLKVAFPWAYGLPWSAGATT